MLLLGTLEAAEAEKATDFGAGDVHDDSGFLSREPTIFAGGHGRSSNVGEARYIHCSDKVFSLTMVRPQAVFRQLEGKNPARGCKRFGETREGACVDSRN
jgi:hypothetical protein